MNEPSPMILTVRNAPPLSRSNAFDLGRRFSAADSSKLCYSSCMIVYEFKLRGKEFQFRIVDEIIRTAQSVRNMALRYWIDNRNIKLYDLNKYCAVLAKQFEWAKKLNSQAETC